MTDNEIKKALECCFDKPFANCNECPLGKCDTCLKKLPKFALDLINRQQAEVERLEKQLNSKYKWENMLDKKIKEVKAEAIKEFAERLKVLCRQARFSVTVTQDITGAQKILDNIAVVDESDIDNLVKEMVGDAE